MPEPQALGRPDGLPPKAANGGRPPPAGSLLSSALAAVERGQIEAAQAMLAQHPQAGLSLIDVFRAYQAELEVRAQQLGEAQRRLEQSLDWFAQLHRALPVAALLVGANGLIVDANDCAATQLGLALGERRRRVPLRRLLARPQDDIALVHLRQALDAQGHASAETLQLRTLQGELRWVDVRATRLPASDAPLGLMTGGAAPFDLYVLTDRTSWVEAQQAREAAAAAERSRAQAEAASRAKSHLLSRVSHELRTPLNAVLGFAYLLKMQNASLPADALRRLDLIHQAGAHLLSLVDEVLEINRAEAGALNLNISRVDLPTMVRDVLAMHEPMAAELDLRLELHVDESAAAATQARADGRRVWEILLNLVSNAVKYNRHGGWVRVSVAPTPEDSARVAVAVADGGIGMSAEQCAHLFEPFNRLGAERIGVAGHGLGLSIAHAYALAMGGEIQVQSQPGEGSCFKLVLPRAFDRSA